MVSRNIQCLKVIVVILDLRSFNHFISHSDKYLLYFFKCYCIRMTMTYIVFSGWKCYINNLCLHLKFSFLLCEVCSCILKHLLDCLSCLVNYLTYLWAFFRSHILHALKHFSKFTFLTKKTYFNLIKSFERVSLINLSSRIFHDFLQTFLHH